MARGLLLDEGRPVITKQIKASFIHDKVLDRNPLVPQLPQGLEPLGPMLVKRLGGLTFNLRQCHRFMKSQVAVHEAIRILGANKAAHHKEFCGLPGNLLPLPVGRRFLEMVPPP